MIPIIFICCQKATTFIKKICLFSCMKAIDYFACKKEKTFEKRKNEKGQRVDNLLTDENRIRKVRNKFILVETSAILNLLF